MVNKYRCPNTECKYFKYIAFYAKEEPEVKECTACHTLHIPLDDDLLTKLAGL